MAHRLFIRIAAREVHPAKAFREGWIDVNGKISRRPPASV